MNRALLCLLCAGCYLDTTPLHRQAYDVPIVDSRASDAACVTYIVIAPFDAGVLDD